MKIESEAVSRSAGLQPVPDCCHIVNCSFDFDWIQSVYYSQSDLSFRSLFPFLRFEAAYVDLTSHFL